jgi:hypothetical protein
MIINLYSNGKLIYTIEEDKRTPSERLEQIDFNDVFYRQFTEEIDSSWTVEEFINYLNVNNYKIIKDE